MVSQPMTSARPPPADDYGRRARSQIGDVEGEDLALARGGGLVQQATTGSCPAAGGRRQSTQVGEVFALERGAVTPDTLGLRLGEAKDLLCAVQETVVDAQVKGTLAAQAACPQAGSPTPGP